MKTPFWFLRPSLISIILLPFSFIYFIISKIVFNIRLLRQQKKINGKIICVGNLLAGGVGKTPIVKEIALFFNAPVIMRGYKQKNNILSDEALLLSNYGLQVHTGNRKKNLELLNNERIVVMDDGFQNPSIKKDISIIVIDEKLAFGNNLLLPAGPMRETKKGLQRADAIIVIKNEINKLKLKTDKPVFYAKTKTKSPYKTNQKIFAFTGIGYPKKFFNSIKFNYKKSFSDHYQYTDKDLKTLIKDAEKKNAKLLTTEKDFVRINEKYRKYIKFATYDVNIEKNFWKWIKEKIND